MADELLSAELATEQAFVDRVYVQLEKSARNAQALAREGYGRGALGHEGGLVERDAMVFQAARRIAQLDAAHEGLVFGRLDLLPELDPEPRYIGRIGLRDDHRDSLLIDWRAPAAAVFYQATAAEPHSVIKAINRQLTHYGYHIGQIVFLAKHFASDHWKTLSVPRGGSAAFNASKMGRTPAK